MKKILVLYCSPRNNGNSALLANAFIRGARKKGHEITEYHLAGKKISPCLACDYCKKNEGVCAQKDDMFDLLHLLQKHDTLVIASPVYYLGFPGSFKNVIDRTYAESVLKRKIKFTILLTTASKSEDSVTEIMTNYYRALANFLGFTNLGVISAKGVEAAGEVNNFPCIDDAYQLGFNLN